MKRFVRLFQEGHFHLPKRLIGWVAIVIALVFLASTYGRLYWHRWQFAQHQTERRELAAWSLDSPTVPVSAAFGLIIPTLQINVPVVPEVDGEISRLYYQKLKGGVAHLKGSATPDGNGNTVIFGHSSTIPGLIPSPYSEVFLNLDQINPNDQITIFYHNQIFTYVVLQVKKVADDDLSILDATDMPRLTLFTCWPPGTDLKRMVVVAKRN